MASHIMLAAGWGNGDGGVCVSHHPAGWPCWSLSVKQDHSRAGGAQSGGVTHTLSFVLPADRL